MNDVMDFIFFILIVIAVIVTPYLIFSRKKEETREETPDKTRDKSPVSVSPPTTTKGADSAERIEQKGCESLYVFSLTASKKVCPYCECENDPTVNRCETCAMEI